MQQKWKPGDHVKSSRSTEACRYGGNAKTWRNHGPARLSGRRCSGRVGGTSDGPAPRGAVASMRCLTARSGRANADACASPARLRLQRAYGRLSVTSSAIHFSGFDGATRTRNNPALPGLNCPSVLKSRGASNGRDQKCASGRGADRCRGICLAAIFAADRPRRCDHDGRRIGNAFHGLAAANSLNATKWRGSCRNRVGRQ